MATLAGAYRSVDGGVTWTKLTGLTAPNVWGIGIGPLEPNVIYAATNDHGIFQSLDYGETWSNVSPLTAYDVPSIRRIRTTFTPRREPGCGGPPITARRGNRGPRREGRVLGRRAGQRRRPRRERRSAPRSRPRRGATWLARSRPRWLARIRLRDHRRSNIPQRSSRSQLVTTISVSLDGGETWQASDKGYLAARHARSASPDRLLASAPARSTQPPQRASMVARRGNAPSVRRYVSVRLGSDRRSDRTEHRLRRHAG